MSAHVVNHYLCPTCGNDWTDTWSCACNDRCPSCGLGDVEPLMTRLDKDERSPQECCEMEMVEAFETVLVMARSYGDGRAGALTDANRTALGLVTAYLLLKVKG